MKRLLVILLVAMAVASFLDGWTWAANPPAVRGQDYSWVCRAFYLAPWVIFAFKAFGIAVFGLFVAGTIVLTRGASSLAERLATDLRHTRALAVTHAARSPEGFVLLMNDSEPYRSYQITDQHGHTVVTTCTIPAGVRCSGGRRFEFGPLGNLQTGSDTRLRIRTEGKTYLLEIVPATGAVTWLQCKD